MELSYEQIKSAAGGTVRFEENELGLELHRFSREQVGFFYKTHPKFCNNSFFNTFFGRNCRSTAGITLDFYTDSKTLDIVFGATELRDDAGVMLFDLYLNGRYVRQFPAGADISTALPGEETRVTLYFPYLSFPVIRSAALSDGASFRSAVKPVTLLAYGDSITHGCSGTHPGLGWLAAVSRELDIGVINQGNSGFIYDADSIERVCDPSVIITAYGVNDYGHYDTPEELYEQAVRFLQKTRKVFPGAKIISILPLWTEYDGDNRGFHPDKRAALEKAYSLHSDCTVDGYSIIPADKKYFVDQVHPNDEGLRFYGKTMTECVRRFLKK